MPQIVELVKQTGLKYMMMETVVYAREFLFIKEMYHEGRAGQDPVSQASHQQDMDGWPNYWPGLPPMHYATHCVGPCLGLRRRAEAEYVSCFGSGTIREELITKYGSPFAVETCHIKIPQLRPRGPHHPLDCSTRPGNIARASTSTARRSRSSGRWSRARSP